MKHIREIYPMVQEVRQRIIKTMQERGIFTVQFCLSKEDYEEKHKNEKEVQDYYDYRDEHCPYVVHFDKYESGSDYCVMSVSLIDGLHPRFKLECEDQYESNTFTDDDIQWLSMLNVYECLEEELGLSEEPNKVWIVKQESNDDGEIHFFVKVCNDETTAKNVLKEWKDALLTKHPKYVNAKPYIDGAKNPDDQICCYEFENENDDSFYIKILGDDYYELLTIEEKEII